MSAAYQMTFLTKEAPTAVSMEKPKCSGRTYRKLQKFGLLPNSGSAAWGSSSLLELGRTYQQPLERGEAAGQQKSQGKNRSSRLSRKLQKFGLLQNSGNVGGLLELGRRRTTSRAEEPLAVPEQVQQQQKPHVQQPELEGLRAKVPLNESQVDDGLSTQAGDSSSDSDSLEEELAISRVPSGQSNPQLRLPIVRREEKYEE